MASTYTPLLRLTLPTTGELTGTWGNTVNTGITTLIENAIAGRVSVTHDDTADYTLTTANGSTDQARYAVVNITGTLTAARNVVCPTASKVYIVQNNTTGGFAFTFKTSAGTGVSVANGATEFLLCDGTNVVRVFTNITTGNLTVTGNTTIGDASGDTLTIAPNAVTWSNNPTHSGNHTFSGNLTIQGNTAIGNASGDTLTVAPNAVTWTNGATHSGAHTFSSSVNIAALTCNSSGNVTLYPTGGYSVDIQSSSGNITIGSTAGAVTLGRSGGSFTFASSAITWSNNPVHTGLHTLRALPTRTTTWDQNSPGGIQEVNAGFTVNTGVQGYYYRVWNSTNAGITVTQGTVTTMRLAGTTTTGNRTIPAYGLATLYFADSGTVIVSGVGVT